MTVTLEEMELVATFLADEADRFVDHCGREGVSEDDARKLIERINDDFKEALDVAFNSELGEQRDGGRISNN